MPTITPNKNYRSVVTAATCAAGSVQASPGASGSINLSATVGPHLLTARVTNGATGPTVGCTVEVQVCGDNTNWRSFSVATAELANGGVYDFPIDIPQGVMYLQVLFYGNTGQAVTVEADLEELTSYTSA